MISRDEMVDRLLLCARRDASDTRDPVSRSRRQKRLEQTGRKLQLFRRPFWGAVRSPIACPPRVDGASWLCLLEKDRPGFGPCVAHWAENDAYPYLAPSQNETVRDHIWCEIHTAWDMEFRPHAGERAKNAESRVLLLLLLLSLLG